LAGKYSRASGAALYVHQAFGVPFVTFIVAFAVMMSGVTSASAAARAFGGSYLAEFVTLPVLVSALIFLSLVTLVNFIGISESIKVNVVLTVIEAFGLLVIIAIGIYALSMGQGNPARAIEFNPANGALLSVLGERRWPSMRCSDLRIPLTSRRRPRIRQGIFPSRSSAVSSPPR
jgi:amino acid transporter